jgi:Type VI secretion system/phage-baseplate injector OB domain
VLDNMNEQDKPDYSGYFIGTVVSNNDPVQIERVKVTIPNLFQGGVDTLPWIGKKKAELFPDARDGSYGTFGLVPTIGTQVIVEFQDSNPLYGLYSATPHQTNERVAEALVNYLYRYGFKDPAGNLFMVDTKPGEVAILIQHVSGTIFRINNSGSFDLISVGDINSSAPNWNHAGIFRPTDVIAGGVSLLGHKHHGVTPGGGDSGGPF